MESLALYIHWPFCLAKCPYCDFNSHVRERIAQSRFRSALLRELEWEAARLGRRRLTSIFFGGGTPSLMEPETVALLIADAKRLFAPADGMEITLEANPTSVEAGRFAAFRDAGVNRVSIGVQSLDGAALGMLGRQHSAAQAIAALETARAIFPRISFDLIYARPGQTLTEWRAELRQALDLAADHLSLYQLTIEPGTKFEVLHRRGEIVLPDDDTAVALYEATAEEAERFGLLGYEVSNYAVPGSESRHNLAYWRYGDYAGIGPGAHGRITLPSASPLPLNDGGSDNHEVVATRRHRAPEPWAERVERDGHGTVEQVALQQIERAREMLLMGMRLTEGIDPGRFAARTGTALEAALDPSVLRQALDEGYLVWRGGCLAATPAGRLRLDALLAAIVR
ncbi:MAG: radical SAM family heme chaperone HemW [Acetobacteraceae bacterium]|jgi:putative oxygen-independent coproporphyrinogen III oxidase